MSEEFNLNLTLSSDNWDCRYPGARVYINDQLIFDDEAVIDPVKINWSGNISDGKNKLVIEMFGKIVTDTLTDIHGERIEDVILNIDSIKFNDVDLRNVPWEESVYYPDKTNDEQAPNEVRNCTNLGWNGRWELEFDSPVFMWLLEKL